MRQCRVYLFCKLLFILFSLFIQNAIVVYVRIDVFVNHEPSFVGSDVNTCTISFSRDRQQVVGISVLHSGASTSSLICCNGLHSCVVGIPLHA